MFSRRLWQLILMIAGLALALGGGVEIAQSIAPGQSIPTRTPTPNPNATATPAPQNTPAPQDTPAPAEEPTATRMPAATATDVPLTGDGALPTAEACSEAPTIQALNGPLNVRNGPGTAYETVDTLSYLEVRLITGRAAEATWWQIRLADGTLAWVADELVAVSGYTGLVPIVEAPALADGSTPTPGPTWAPTPNPTCPSPTPTATGTATATATATGTATATVTATATAERVEEAAVEEEPPTPMPTVEPEPEMEATATVSAEPAVEGEEAEGGSGIWLPVVGVLLIGAAVVLFVRGRRTA